MRPLAFRSVLLPALLLTCACRAQDQPTHPIAAPVDDPYKNEAIVWEHFDTTIRMHADGTGTRTVHVVARLLSEGAARQFSVLTIPYASAYETGKMDFIRVHKPDGSVVETPTDEAIEMPAAMTREAPLYSDLKEKQLPVRSVAARDAIDYEFHTERINAEAPGQFWGSEHFLMTAGVVLSQTLTLEVPSGKYVQVWDPHHPSKPVDHNGTITYSWTRTQTKPTQKTSDKTDANGEAVAVDIKDPDEDADGRLLPSVAWTTFHSWAEVGAWYRNLSVDRIRPTPAIQDRANKLTADAETPEAQVQALYDFVAMKTRYVGIDFGVGRYQPHTAEEVMSHEYGDCKDKDTLLKSLLRAKGFATAPALIGFNLALVPELPSPGSFNHVITTVELPAAGPSPEHGRTPNRIWLDTTPEVAPFKVLVPQIRDEQALMVPATGPASLERTPADPPFPYLERFTATGSLDKDGLLKSRMDISLRSDNELGFRVLLQRAAPAQWDEAMQSISTAMGFGGKVSDADLKQADRAGPVHIAYNYSRPEFGDWSSHRILPLFPMLEVPVIDKDNAPDHDIDQGAPRTLEAITRIRLPDGFRADLPDAVHVRRSYATFDKTYRLQKGELEVERKVVILTRKIPKADWKDYLAYTKAAGITDGESYIPLLESATISVTKLSGKSVTETKSESAKSAETQPTNAPALPKATAKDSNEQAPSPALSDADAQKLLSQAFEAARANDPAQEMIFLSRLKSARPDFPYLMSMLGVLALSKGHTDEAIQDLKTELKNHHDDNAGIPLALAAAYEKQERHDEAIALLKSYSDRNDKRMSAQLASLQQKAGDNEGALQTAQSYVTAHPEDRFAKVSLSGYLHRLHREADAAAAARSAMEDSDDPYLLNDAAYRLAETKLDLPVAEKASRHSIELAESASAAVTLQEANNNAFKRTEILVASWDTLGWILFEEGKPAEAEPYLRAAWFHRLDVSVGYHLAQMLEAEGKPSEALTVDDLALASDSTDKDTRTKLAVDVERLKEANARSTAGNATQALLAMRTFHVDRPKTLTGSATVRIQLGEGGIKDYLQMTGDDALQPVVGRLRSLAMTNVVPSGSHALLVRDAILDCSPLFPTCEFVLMPHSDINMEVAQ